MRLLLDTQLLLWIGENSPRLSAKACRLIEDEANELHFSALSVWEVAIKTGRGRRDFEVDPQDFRESLLSNGYREVPIASRHAIGVTALPPIHKDPFDRLLIAQAAYEEMFLATSDDIIARYPGNILEV